MKKFYYKQVPYMADVESLGIHGWRLIKEVVVEKSYRCYGYVITYESYEVTEYLLEKEVNCECNCINDKA